MVSGLESAAEDEKNLLYVAMTRAKKYLALNTSVLNLLCSVHHNFEKLKISENFDFEKVKNDFERRNVSSSNCVDCQESRKDEENIFVLERPSEFLNQIFLK